MYIALAQRTTMHKQLRLRARLDAYRSRYSRRCGTAYATLYRIDRCGHSHRVHYRLPGNAFLSRHFLERRVDYRCRLPRATCHLRARTRYNAAQDPRYDFLNWLTHRRNFIYHAICPRPYRTTLFYRLRSTLGVAGDEVLFIDLAAFMTTAANTPRGFWANWHYWSCRLI